MSYARKFGECNGRGQELETAYAELVKAVGAGKAAACKVMVPKEP